MGSWRSPGGVESKDFGRFTQGALTDLLRFREDPPKRFAAFSTLETVVSRGKLCRQRDLLESAKAWRAFYEISDVNFVAQAVSKQKMKAPLKSDSFL
jgi:hypothetical protein